MLVGERYADNKLYRGLKHYNSLPLTSEDIHESEDILYKKAALFAENIIGSGTLNEPSCTIDEGISLDSPSVVLLDGDIVLIQSTSKFVTATQITAANYSSGLICVIGWYQLLDSTSTLREYGGVNNDTITNDILDENLSIQVSKRYQFRWDSGIVDKDGYLNGADVGIYLNNRDNTGAVTTGNYQVHIDVTDKMVRQVDAPESMTYAVSDLYVIPIIEYEYSNSTITSAKAVKALKPAGGSEILKSSDQPTGEQSEGTLWYNTSSYDTKLYLENTGFVPLVPESSIVQYRSDFTISEASTTSSNVTVSIGILSYEEDDILQVSYNGVLLTETSNYTIDHTNNQITLLGFITEVGDIITFVVKKLQQYYN